MGVNARLEQTRNTQWINEWMRSLAVSTRVRFNNILLYLFNIVSECLANKILIWLCGLLVCVGQKGTQWAVGGGAGWRETAETANAVNCGTHCTVHSGTGARAVWLVASLINWLGTECGNTPRWLYRSTPTTFVDRWKISRLADVKHMLNHRTASEKVEGG